MKENQKKKKSKKKIQIKQAINLLEFQSYIVNLKEIKLEYIFKRLNFFAFRVKKFKFLEFKNKCLNRTNPLEKLKIKFLIGILEKRILKENIIHLKNFAYLQKQKIRFFNMIKQKIYLKNLQLNFYKLYFFQKFYNEIKLVHLNYVI